MAEIGGPIRLTPKILVFAGNSAITLVIRRSICVRMEYLEGTAMSDAIFLGCLPPRVFTEGCDSLRKEEKQGQLDRKMEAKVPGSD